VTQGNGAGILESLGLDGTISGTTLTGSSVFSLNTNTALQSLNDGRGVAIRQASGIGVEDFTITVDPGGVNQVVKVRIGDIEGDDGSGNTVVLQGKVSTVGGVIDRINTALSDAGFSEFTASINTTTGGIDISDTLNRDFDITNFSSASGVVTTLHQAGVESQWRDRARGHRRGAQLCHAGRILGVCDRCQRAQ